jgi:hypothetical protein
MSYMKKTRYALFACCICLFSCGGGGGSSNSPENNAAGQQEAQAFLSQIISIMRTNALTRNDVDFGNLETEVNQLAADANSISDTYPAVTRALELLNTNHSFLNSPSGSLITYPSNIVCEQPFDIDSSSTAGIGYVRVDAVSTRDGTEGQEIATMIQENISRQDSPDVTRWIVDLRNNLGGNVFPMIAGLGPLFDQTTLGFFIDPDENQTAYGYNNGSAFVGDNNVVTVDQPYTLINPQPRIAVLASTRTASSGEATFIAFLKQFNVRTFGTDTCGLSTANTPFVLNDGSTLFLTTAVMADRELQRYGERVAVDQRADPEAVIAEAISWLQGQ